MKIIGFTFIAAFVTHRIRDVVRGRSIAAVAGFDVAVIDDLKNS